MRYKKNTMYERQSRPLRVTALALLASAILILGALPIAAGPKEYLIDLWRFDADLPRDGIISIAQGPDGYLWVSSRYDLARFDGARFVNFSSLVGAQFLGHHYAELATDGSGAVWIGTPGAGLAQWREGRLIPCVRSGNPVFGPVVGGLTNGQGRAVAVTPDGRVIGWTNGVAQPIADGDRWGGVVRSSLCQGKAGDIWFVTYQHKLVRVRGTNAQEMTYGSGEEGRNWIALQVDGAGELWAGTQRKTGVWRGDRFEPVASPVESAFPVEDIIAVPKAERAPGSGGTAEGSATGTRLWVIALGRAWLREGNRWVTNLVYESAAGVYETSPRLADRAGNLWFTATKGRIVRAGVDGTLTILTEEQGLPPGRIACFCYDREGSMWAAIEHAGLARLRERHFTPIGTREGMKAPLVWAVVEDSAGAIWLGTENGGVQRWQEGRLTQFNLGNGGLAGSVYSLCLDREGRLWAGTGDDSVYRFENGKFALVWEDRAPGWNKRVYAIYEDRAGQMWFGTRMGLFCWREGTLRRITAKDFEMAVVRAIAEDASGRLWFGMSGGPGVRLARLEGEELIAQGVHEALVGCDVFGLHADPDGSLWVGTVGAGLWRYRDGEYTHYTTKGSVQSLVTSGAEVIEQGGLPDDRIYSMARDQAGNLWLGSPAGIIRLTGESVAGQGGTQTVSPECLVFNRTDGLPTRECSGGTQPVIFQGRNGRMLFALTEGSVALTPASIQVNAVPPPVIIEEVRSQGKLLAVPVEHWPRGAVGDGASGTGGVGALHLGRGRQMVELRYTATSLVAPSKVRFKCRFEGVENQWREADTSRSAMYALTAPGDYRFRVIACNNDGVWNETGAALRLTVPPYFWQTWWFKIALFGGTLLGVGGAIRFVERGMMRRRLDHLEMQQMLEKERARIARDIHDDLGASLTEIGLLSEFAQRDSAPPEQVKADVRGIAAKARSSTRALDEIVWAVNPRNDTLEGFVTYASAYAAEQLRVAEIRCRLEAASPLPPRLLRADRRHHLFLAFKEALNNVVKHARASEVEIRMRVGVDWLSIVISDNGSGFVREGNGAARAAGNRLVNMRERLESAGGRFECESALGRGTRVELRMGLS